MGARSWAFPDPAGVGRPLIGFCCALGFGVFGGVLFVAGSYIDPLVGALLLLGLPITIVVVSRPTWGVFGFIFILLVLEEFPWGYGETVERATRTAFYSLSLGLPGLYSTDVLLGGMLAIYMLHALVGRGRLVFHRDPIATALLVIGLTLLVSVVVSFQFPDLMHVPIERTGVAYKVNERGAQLIAFFQFKIYGYLFGAYLLGQWAFDRPERLQQIIRLFLCAAVVNVGMGVLRLVQRPDIVGKTIPLFYHSPTSWLFGLTTFFIISLWALGRIQGGRAFALAMLAAILMLFVLISFRRTLWAAIIVAAALLPLLLPSRARARAMILFVILGVGFGLALMLTPAGEAVVSAVAERIGQTSTEDASTVYRLALATYVVREFWDIPLFGYGARPLWDKFAHLGYFRTNLENIHSLYYWWLLRTGIVGLIVALSGFGVIVIRLYRDVIAARQPEHRAMLVCIVLALVMLLFSGLFNPVYGEARYMALMGFALALATRLRTFQPGPALPPRPNARS